MVFDISKVTGIGEYEVETRKEESKGSSRFDVYKVKGHAFLIVNSHTIEVRTDEKLKKLLVEKNESVMESLYFGRGGIEIVMEGQQLRDDEIWDLVRLSYNMTKEFE